MSDDPLVALALRLTDGESIDWKAESERGDLDPSLVHLLKQIDAVARAHEHDTPTDTYVSTEPPAVVARLPSGSYWGQLEIIELIGSGSYGDVYRARDTRLGRDVALKLLRTQGSAEPGGSSLVTEGHLLSRVRHANVVTVHGADCLDGMTGLWMELIEGETLEQEVRRRGAFAAAEVAHIGAVLSDALDAVHAAGLLHRDVKAQNVMRDRAGRLVLMDFGSGHDAQRLSDSTVQGTPLYAAPEVLNGEPPSVRSDIYSLGVLLWYLLTGNYPVNGRSVGEIKRALARRRITKLEGIGTGSVVASIAAECLTFDPRKRPRTASELGSRLGACTQPSGPRRRSIRNVAGLAAFTAAVFLLATAPLQLSSKSDSRGLVVPEEPIWSFYSGAKPAGAPSADGHYFACSGFGFPVAICDVSTGTVQRVPITVPSTTGDVRPLISPDGQRVAYHGLEPAEAKVFDLSTLVSESIRVNPSLVLEIIGWSASGDSLLVLLRPTGSIRHALVALLDINSGTQTDLRQLDLRPEGLALSHDRRRLAFAQNGGVHVTNLATGETLQIAGPADVHGSLLWVPNDDGVLFTSGRNRSELHLMRLADGHPVGEVEALHAYGTPPFTLLGISPAGDVYYNAESRLGDVLYTSSTAYPQPATLYLADFDTATQQIGTPTNIAKLASRLGADWSPDSKSIAYARSDGTERPTIVIRNASTGVERTIELPEDVPDPSIELPLAPRFLERESLPWIGVVRWSARAKILAHAGTNKYLVDPDDNSVRRVEVPLVISPFDGTFVRRFEASELYMPDSVEWAPDGSSVYYAGSGSVRAVDVDTGLVTESHSLPEIPPQWSATSRTWVQLSVWQRLVAYSKTSGGSFEGGQVDLAALDDSVSNPLLISNRPCRPVGWWNGEMFAACLNDSKAPSLSQLYLVNVATGTKKAIPVNLQRIEHVRVRPDGLAIAIMAGRTTSGTFVLKVPSSNGTIQELEVPLISSAR